MTTRKNQATKAKAKNSNAKQSAQAQVSTPVQKQRKQLRLARHNRVHISGYLAADPEIRYTPLGTAVCSFCVITNDGFYNAEDVWQERNTPHYCTAFAKNAERVADGCVKGSPVDVTGRLLQNSWEDKDTEQRRYRTYIQVRQVQMLEIKTKTPVGSEEDN